MTTYTTALIGANTNNIDSDGKALNFDDYIKDFVGIYTYNSYTDEIDSFFEFQTLPSFTEAELQAQVNAFNAKTLTPIENIAENWQTLYVDYKQARQDMKQYVLPRLPVIYGGDGSWVNMSLVEKQICCKWFLFPESMRIDYYTLSEQVIQGDAYNVNQTNSRKKRFNACKMFLFNLLAWANVNEVINDVTLVLFDSQYINYGRESLVSDGTAGLFDYVAGTATYTLTGLNTKPFTPTLPDLTMQQVSDGAMDIIQNGNY